MAKICSIEDKEQFFRSSEMDGGKKLVNYEKICIYVHIHKFVDLTGKSM